MQNYSIIAVKAELQYHAFVRMRIDCTLIRKMYYMLVNGPTLSVLRTIRTEGSREVAACCGRK